MGIFFAGWMNMSPEPDEFLLPYYRSGSLLTLVDDPRADALLVEESAFSDLEGRARFMREEVVAIPRRSVHQCSDCAQP